MNLLEKLLHLRGIESYDQLDEQEQATFSHWQEVYNKEVSVESISDFTKSEISRLQNELLESTKNGEERRSLLITAKIENYQSIQAIIRAVDLEKEQVDAELKALIANHND